MGLPGGINNGDIFDFLITDDGLNLSYTLTEVGDPSNTATVLATSNFAPITNLLTFHNRENGSRTALLDNLLVESLTLQTAQVPEPASIALWGVLGALLFGWARRRRAVK